VPVAFGVSMVFKKYFQNHWKNRIAWETTESKEGDYSQNKQKLTPLRLIRFSWLIVCFFDQDFYGDEQNL
jgi:hypothetical protein